MTDLFNERMTTLQKRYEDLIRQRNVLLKPGNGAVDRWRDPVLSAEHTPIHWRYDLNQQSNPFAMERLGINAVFNPGAIKHNGQFVLVARVEGADRKSFFALATSDTGVDQFRFHDLPIDLPETDDVATNVYDMRLTPHEDGWIYGLFCVERHDKSKPNDAAAAVAQCGIVRTHDLVTWERLPDLITNSSQQRNVVLHPEFVDGTYMLYTRPQDGFIDAGAGGGIAYGFTASMDRAIVQDEKLLDPRLYHTIKESKNGQGPSPIETAEGWLHLAHGVRNTAAGLRYVLYLFMTSLDRPWVVTHSPGGHFLAPLGDERIGDVSNVLFSNGWVQDEDGQIYLYYASSDTRIHVATTTIEQLLDYTLNTPSDGLTTGASVQNRINLAKRNLQLMGS